MLPFPEVEYSAGAANVSECVALQQTSAAAVGSKSFRRCFNVLNVTSRRTTALLEQRIRSSMPPVINAEQQNPPTVVAKAP
jgi:hypothetical protein